MMSFWAHKPFFNYETEIVVLSQVANTAMRTKFQHKMVIPTGFPGFWKDEAQSFIQLLKKHTGAIHS